MPALDRSPVSPVFRSSRGHACYPRCSPPGCTVSSLSTGRSGSHGEVGDNMQGHPHTSLTLLTGCSSEPARPRRAATCLAPQGWHTRNGLRGAGLGGHIIGVGGRRKSKAGNLSSTIPSYLWNHHLRSNPIVPSTSCMTLASVFSSDMGKPTSQSLR